MRKEKEKKEKEERELRLKKEEKEKKMLLKKKREEKKQELTDIFNKICGTKRYDKYYLESILERLNDKEVNFFLDKFEKKKISSGDQFDKLFKKLQ